jgi:hypothetical protein
MCNSYLLNMIFDGSVSTENSHSSGF